VTLSSELLGVLSNQTDHNFQYVITGDKSRFFIPDPFGAIWATSRSLIPEMAEQKIRSDKCLMSLLLSVKGIQSHLAVPKCLLYKSDFFRDHIIPDLIADVAAQTRKKMLKN
jgi:hypothetical protein